MCCSSASPASATSKRPRRKSGRSRGFSTCPTPSWPTTCSAMPRLQSRTSRISRASSPALDLEVPPSRRLQALAVLFLVLLAGSLVFASAPAPAWRALAGLCTGLLLWPSMRALVFQRGPRAVRRLSWAPDGRWFIVLGDGIEQEVFLHPSSAALGPCLMLAWTSTPGPLARRCYALIDGASV